MKQIGLVVEFAIILIMNKTKKVVMKKEKKLYCEKCLLLVEHKKNHCKYCGARVRKEKVEPFNFKPIAKMEDIVAVST